jgi:MFS family permease
MFADLRSLPRAFWVLFAGMFINRFGTFVWPFLTIYLTRSGYSLTHAATAVSAVGVGAFAGSVFGGWLSDHIGRRHTIVVGTFGASVAVMLLYAAGSFPSIVLSAMLMGLASGTYHPAASALLADIVPPEQRVRAYAAFRLAANAGFACGAAAGGVLANYSIFWLFAGDALTTALYGGIALFWLPHGLRAQTQKAPWGEAIGLIRRDGAFHALWLAAFCSALVFSQFGSTYSLHVIGEKLTLDVFGWHLAPETVYGLLIAWNGLLVMLLELPLTSLTLRFDGRRVIALGHVLIGLGFGLNAWADQIPTLLVAMTIFTLGEMISAPTTSAFVAHLAPERVRGRYMGALALAWNASAIAGPQLGFRLFALDPRFVWFGSAVLGLTAATVTILLAKAGQRNDTPPPAVTGPDIDPIGFPPPDGPPGRPARKAIS